MEVGEEGEARRLNLTLHRRGKSRPKREVCGRPVKPVELESRPEVSSQVDSLASPEPAGLVTELLYEDQLLQGVDGGQAAVLLQHSQLTISSRRTDPNSTAGLELTEDL